MIIKSMTGRTGREVANQIIITDGNKRTFYSYGTPIAEIEGGNVSLNAGYWDYSVTTGKYRNKFLGETKKETQAKIDAGIYTLKKLS
jgi:hypothetical protein